MELGEVRHELQSSNDRRLLGLPVSAIQGLRIAAARETPGTVRQAHQGSACIHRRHPLLGKPLDLDIERREFNRPPCLWRPRLGGIDHLHAWDVGPGEAVRELLPVVRAFPIDAEMVQ